MNIHRCIGSHSSHSSPIVLVTDRSHDDQHHAHWSRTIETIDRSQQRENPVWPAQCGGGGGGGGGGYYGLFAYNP